jgi:2-C-methyl-D-erythritol 2,4-cyclodiphosphate synthase/2-C-methyl-D-erythritol 4-phosphate cytidylyltransferase
MKVSVLIAAAGEGKRLRASFSKARHISKVLLPLNGQPMLVSSMLTFQNVPEVKEIIIASHARNKRIIQALVKRLTFSKPVKVIVGGKTRAESVCKMLQASNRQTTHVMIHDGARPFIDREDIKKLFTEFRKSQWSGAVLGRRVSSTIKKVSTRSQAILNTVKRQDLWEAETPQLFSKPALKEAYQKWKTSRFEATDDASLLECLGHNVKMVEAANFNLKVTTFSDFKLSDVIFKGREIQKVGIGDDIHRLVAGRKLKLGGIHIPHTKGALGHSDGDALLHAITDALLGASGRGDIGEHFPDTKKSLRGIDSRKILKNVWQTLQKQAFELVAIDATIFIQTPKIAPFKAKMKRQIAQILEINPDQVNLKAKTMEGLGLIGREEAVAARAVAVLSQARSL